MSLVLFYVPLLASADLKDAQLGLWLSVAPSLALVLLGLVVKSVNLGPFFLGDDFGRHLCAFDEWRAQLDLAAITNHDDRLQFHLGPRFTVELFDDDEVVFLRFVLLSASLNNRVHGSTRRKIWSAEHHARPRSEIMARIRPFAQAHFELLMLRVRDRISRSR